MIYKLLSILLASSLISFASAKEYGHYDIQKVTTVVAENKETKQYKVNLNYLDQILNDLLQHAQNYPTYFDNDKDRERAIQDTNALSKMFEALLNTSTPNFDILMRAASLNSLGHNLAISGSANRAHTAFQGALEISPDHPQANFLYGVFLANSNNLEYALAYLEQSQALGVVDAAYSVAMVHLALGNKEKALELLEAYQKTAPSNREKVNQLIEAINNGSIKINLNPNSHY